MPPKGSLTGTLVLSFLSTAVRWDSDTFVLLYSRSEEVWDLSWWTRRSSFLDFLSFMRVVVIVVVLMMIFSGVEVSSFSIMSVASASLTPEASTRVVITSHTPSTLSPHLLILGCVVEELDFLAFESLEEVGEEGTLSLRKASNSRMALSGLGKLR